MAVPSKSLWLFYLFCQLFVKPIKRDKFLFKEMFLFYIILCEVLLTRVGISYLIHFFYIFVIRSEEVNFVLYSCSVNMKNTSIIFKR